MSNQKPEKSPYAVAIVDDEEDFSRNVSRFLEAQGFSVWSSDSAENFYRLLAVTHADLVIVDLGLPGEDGLSLIAHLHSYGRYSIIALTARGSLKDRIAGLDAGADYYFVKPVDLYELAAGINAVLRKKHATDELRQTSTDAEPGEWILLRGEALLVTPDGVTIELTSGELRLLEFFMNHAEEVISKFQLLELFGQRYENGDFHRIEVLVSRLRAKVKNVAGHGVPLRAVFGKGMVFVGSCAVRR